MKTIALKFLFTVSIWKFILYSNHSLVLILFLTILYKFSLFYSTWQLFKYLKAKSKLFFDWTLLRLWNLGPFFLSWAISKYLCPAGLFEREYWSVTTTFMEEMTGYLFLALKTGRMQWTRKDIWADYLHLSFRAHKQDETTSLISTDCFLQIVVFS